MIFKSELVFAAVFYLAAFLYLGAGNNQLGLISGLAGIYFLANQGEQ